MKKSVLYSGLILFAVQCLSGANADDRIEFNRDIRPILADKCYACHGPDKNKRKAKLRLDLDEDVYTKRKEGHFVLKPGSLKDSELWYRVTTKDPDDHMPPAKTNKTLSPSEKDTIKRWIEQGAKWQGHWAFIPPKKSPVPKSETQNPIDAFVRKKLKEVGLKPSPEADKQTLIRRLYFDLVGLPPKAEAVDRFLQDKRPDAYEKLVDELLASKHFGERMAMYWLDVVRFADSNGYHSDEPRQVAPYRDYVIDAFNKNKPYDRFVIEQLAGDLLPEASIEAKIGSGFNMLLQTTKEGGAQAKEYLAKYAADRVRNSGTIFMGLTLGCAECHNHKFDPVTIEDFYSMEAFFADIKESGLMTPPAYPVPALGHKSKLEALDKQIAGLQAKMNEKRKTLKTEQEKWESEQVSKVADTPVSSPWHMIGPFTAGSFDEAHGKAFPPETEIDLAKAYGNLKWQERANFVDGKIHTLSGDNSATYLYRTIDSSTAQPLELSLGSDDSIKLWVNGQLAYENKIARGVAVDQDKATIQLKAGQNKILYKITNGGGGYGFFYRVSRAGLPDNIVRVLKTPPPDRQPKQREELDRYYESIAPQLETLRVEIAGLETKKNELSKSFPKTVMTVSVNPRTIRLLPRGDWLDDSGPEMKPEIPKFFGSLNIKDRRANRLDLAKWLTDRSNPLTSRNFVNRLWKLYFGQGISSRLDDLGSQGQWPTNPELLDWLAVDFMENKWDVKRIIKSLVLSSTYRQQSLDNETLQLKDPKNGYFARQSRWRIDAEMVRDNALSISGLLVEEVGGPSVKPYQPAGYWRHMNFPKRSWKHDKGDSQYRRGLYTWWQRMFLHPSLLAFDAPSREESCVERPRSNTPQQALALLNDPTYVESARVFAQRMLKEGGDSAKERINWAYKQALSREVTPDELNIYEDIFKRHHDQYNQDKTAAASFVTIGEEPADPSVDPIELASWSSVSRIILNLHETITRR